MEILGTQERREALTRGQYVTLLSFYILLQASEMLATFELSLVGFFNITLHFSGHSIHIIVKAYENDALDTKLSFNYE